jgi:hypothetical protein
VHVVLQGAQAPPSIYISKAIVHVVLQEPVASARRRPQIFICQ